VKAPDREIGIAGRRIGPDRPTYFVADVAANHDGDLSRARALIHLAAEAGADAVKFQHFQAPHIVSDYGFRQLGAQQSHQAKWPKPVFQVYQDASLSLDWTPVLAETCREAGVAFLSSPYSFELVDHLEPFVPAYKIGSGDITWPEIVRYIAAKGKPVLLATGASAAEDVDRAVRTVLEVNSQLVLMQCNTNYTAGRENLRHVCLNVLGAYRSAYPGVVLGLSDHTLGDAAVLGAVALGARLVEKHFTDDNGRVGPDHGFAMTPRTWREMIERTRDLEAALGSSLKRVEANESETVVLQRRCLRAARALAAGTVLAAGDLEPLRPCPPDGLPPYELAKVLGRRLSADLAAGDYLRESLLDARKSRNGRDVG
jgi:sialic acid synthase SpsE